MEEIGIYIDDQYCFCCGEKNPYGFKMRFRYENEKIFSEIAVAREYQGFSNVVHGGVIGTLLDELMVNFHWRKGRGS